MNSVLSPNFNVGNFLNKKNKKPLKSNKTKSKGVTDLKPPANDSVRNFGWGRSPDMSIIHFGPSRSKFSRNFSFKIWWRHNDAKLRIWKKSCGSIMHKVIRFRMRGSNKLYLLWFSRNFTFKIWWRHNDVIIRIWKKIMWPNKCTKWYGFICVAAISSICYGSLVISLLKFDDVIMTS